MKKIYEDTPGNIVKFKRRPEIKAAFAAIIAARTQHLADKIRERFQGDPECLQPLTQESSLSLLERLGQVEQNYIREAKSTMKPETAKQRCQVLAKQFKTYRQDALDPSADREDLFLREEHLRIVVEASDQQLSSGMIQQMLSHCSEQIGLSFRERYKNIDAGRLTTLDGDPLADQEQNELAGTLDQEDLAVLLELYFTKRGKANSAPGLQSFQHIVVDEAQDLAPLERQLLGRALSPTGSMTIAGDAVQQIDPGAAFRSWNQVLDELGQSRVSPRRLTTTYRSSRPIAEFAHHVLGPLAPPTPPKAIKDGVPVSYSRLAKDGQIAMVLNESLHDLLLAEPHATVAIIAKTFETASGLYDVLQNLGKVKLVENGDFDFRPGVEITDASQVKGLEFDYAIIPDASFRTYFNTPEDRRMLHVAATRAIHQLWVLSTGEPSAIVGDYFGHSNPE